MLCLRLLGVNTGGPARWAAVSADLGLLSGEHALAEAHIDLSWHARRRTHELGFSVRDVADCVRRAEQSYSCHPGYGSDRRIYQRGDVCVVLHEPTRVVVTVLLRRADRWHHGHDRRISD